MDMKYTAVESIVFLEYSLITLTILSSLIFTWIEYVHQKNKEKSRSDIENYLTHLIQSKNNNFSCSNFPKKWRRLDLLLPSVIKFDQQFNDEAWTSLRLRLLNSIMLPLARTGALSKDWALQFYAAQTFELHAEDVDMGLFTKIIQSPLPAVQIAALRATLQYDYETSFNTIMNQIEKLPYLTQSVYFQAFANAATITRPYIEKILKSSSISSLRSVCYHILLNYPPGAIEWDFLVDIHSKNESLKLAALRWLAYAKKDSSLPILMDQLADNNWKTKVVTLNALGYLSTKTTIPKIVECLHDENWWVRLNAAQALKNLGEEGELALAKRMDVNLKDFEAVRHVLRIL